MLQKLDDDIRMVIAAGQAEDQLQQQQHMQVQHEQAPKGQKRPSDQEATIAAMLEMAEGMPDGQPKQSLLDAARMAMEAVQQRRPNPANAAEQVG